MKAEVQQELESIYARDGALLPQAVVEAAKSKESALHSQFQWDDGKAAGQYRLEQARRLIRVAVTVIPNISNKPMRQFVSISSLRHTGTGSYIAMVDVLSDEEQYAQARQDALEELLKLEARYRHIAEFQPIWDAINAAASEIVSKAA